ncbi:MAG TPA: hypothetical protein VHN11_21175 [Xanthobacteraceae bacterium]|jgi:hypothetical protein|nr:hypothetical protein [Xanthobacteraceae bacterium]
MIAVVFAFLAQVADAVSVTPVGILVAVNGAITVGLGAIYRDCRREREKLWAHIRELERRLGGR